MMLTHSLKRAKAPKTFKMNNSIKAANNKASKYQQKAAKGGQEGNEGGINQISVTTLEMILAISNNNRSGQIDPINLEAAAEEYVLSYLNAEFLGINMNIIDVTLTFAQTTPGLPNRSTVIRYNLSVTITYLPSGGEAGPKNITSAVLRDLLLTQLILDDFVSTFQDDDTHISALIIGASAVTASTPAPTLPPIRLPAASTTICTMTSTTLKPTALPTAVPKNCLLLKRC